MHLLHAEPRRTRAVAQTLAEAGRRALASGALDRGRRLPGARARRAAFRPERSALLLDLARAEHGLGRPEALDRVLEASDAAVDEVQRAHAAIALMWASGPGRQDPLEALAMVERALAGVAGRHRELELGLEAVRLMATFMSTELMQHALGEPSGSRTSRAVLAGECALLLHVAIHRFLLGRSAADVAEPLDSAVADPELVAAIGPESAWLNFVVGALFKTDRLDLPVARWRSRPPRRSAVARHPGSGWRRCGGRGSR